jgi:hypothetical protein
MAADLPIIMTAQGAQPTPPATLLAQLLALATAAAPGLTADLPGSLIEDISSTDVGALTVIDQARVDLINSLTPFGANVFLLIQLGNIYGVQQGVDTNTSALVNFSGTPGFVIARGFIVSDGTNQFTVQDGAIIPTDGTALNVGVVATNPGSFAVPEGTITEVISNVPGDVTLSVTNAQAGVPGLPEQSEADFRAQVIQAGLAVAQGTPNFVKTQLQKVSGVVARLVSMRPLNGGWEIICGGGDPYEVANAIFQGMDDINVVQGSELLVAGITNANPGVVATELAHGYTTGQHVVIEDVVGMTEVNGGAGYTATVIDATHFSIGVDTSSYTPYASGGIVTPNLRNVTVSINDYPDTYTITYVNPPQQAVSLLVEWNTTSVNFVSTASVAQLGGQALLSYINSIPVGNPINLFVMQQVFQTAIANLIPPALLSRMVFTVSINSVVTAPDSGTGLIEGDPESYFEATTGSITIEQA